MTVLYGGGDRFSVTVSRVGQFSTVDVTLRDEQGGRTELSASAVGRPNWIQAEGTEVTVTGMFSDLNDAEAGTGTLTASCGS